MAPNKIRGIIYYRVSTEDQAQFGVSLDQQKKNCLNYAESNNIEIIKMFHDDGVSAKTTDRPSLQEMLKFCNKRNKGMDCVIVYKIDRLSRNVNDYSNITILLNKLNIKLISTTEAIDNTPTGKFIGNIMAASAQFDNDTKSQRITDCLREKREQGYWCGKAPVGYLNTTNRLGKKVIAVDKKRAPLIKWIFERFSTGIYTLEELRIMANKKGLRSWNEKEISAQLMSKFIKRKFYIGIMTVKGEEYEGNYEHIISDQVFYKCQNILTGENRAENISRNQANENFPLRHFVICAYCGRPLTAYFATGRWGGKYPYYRCYNKNCDSRKSIAKKKLEKDFLRYLEEITPKKTFLDPFKAIVTDVWKKRYKELNKHRKDTLKVLENLKEEKVKLIEMRRKELFSDEDFKEAFDKLKQEILDKQIILDENEIKEFNIDKAVTYVFDFIATIPEYWSKASYDQKIKIQGLIFPEKPIYGYERFQTPEISPVLAIKKESYDPNSPIVPPRGVEPLLLG